MIPLFQFSCTIAQHLYLPHAMHAKATLGVSLDTLVRVGFAFAEAPPRRYFQAPHPDFRQTLTSMCSEPHQLDLLCAAPRGTQTIIKNSKFYG